ncbi:AMP-dependent synthetase [Halalkalibacillus sediminis]|uniref:AMP-dependent synthetase n=1 Tax=Halalkalibacillus sediminis TaxID=2018042 RepID=A0A2I0QRL3_9BACI|nr:AMP-dependent synthetase [Halalkalibacillus sediminis]
MIKLIYVLYKMKILSPIGLNRLIKSVRSCGINLMTLLDFAEKNYGERVAVIDDHETIRYQQLLNDSWNLAVRLHEEYEIVEGRKVGIICKNHGSLVKSIFALSRLGVDTYLLNSEMSEEQFNDLQDHHQFDLLVYDFKWSSAIENSIYKKGKLLSYDEQLPAINNLHKRNELARLPRTKMGKLMLLTGGTTGKSKAVEHQPSLFNYLNPFLTLLTRLKLINYQTAYIATPIYHGYGIAILLSFIALGKKMIITQGFDAHKACGIIRKHEVEVVSVVPLMVHKMLRTNSGDLQSLSCIASGGAALNPKLIEEVFNEIGDILYNLYGTSESGLNIVAKPEDLKYSLETVGKKINGSRLKVLDDNHREVANEEVGQLCMKNNWSMRNKTSSWIETGDLGYRDSKGYYFLCGRTDEMIVSAGENVYPIELEQTLNQHDQIEDVAVIGVSDEEFGQRLKAYVQAKEGLSQDELWEWLRPRVARFQVPKEIEFIEEIPYTPVGKRDKKQLKSSEVGGK